MSEDSFQKYVKKYKSKFGMDKANFLLFVTSKIDLKQKYHNRLTSFLENKIPKHRQFDDDELREFLHYISACQDKVQLESIHEDQLSQYRKISFRQSKDKKQKTDRQRKEQSNENKQQLQCQDLDNKNDRTSFIQIIQSDGENSTLNKQAVIIKVSQEQQKQQIEKCIEQQQSNQIDQDTKVNRKDSHQQQQIKTQTNSFDEGLLMVKGKENEQDKQLIKIPKFEKFGQDIKGPIIKFQIIYKKKHQTWRRYSEIQKILNYLKFKYEGIVLPEMPPKQGIKGNFNFLWFNGINEGFLDERRQKIKNMLNKLLNCTYVFEDVELERFLTQEDYNFDAIGNSDSYLSTLAGLKDIVFNYSQLMNYGTAYYNYITEYKKKNVETECTKEYDKMQVIITSIISLNQHRKTVNANFENRREIMFNFSIRARQLKKTDFDNMLEEAEIECNELSKQYGRYLQLKSTEGWQNQLIKQKSGKAQEQIKETYKKTQERIKKLQYYLMQSLKKFGKKNEEMLENLGKHILEWRKTIHP